jgi:hypothetical protein
MVADALAVAKDRTAVSLRYLEADTVVAAG